MSIIAWFMGTRIGRALAAIGALIGAIAFFWFEGRMSGRRNAQAQAKQQDLQHANDTYVAAQAAQAAAAHDKRPVDQQLRDLGGLRD